MVLNHLPGNAGDVGCLSCKHIDIRPQEGDERVFLFVVKGGAYGESPSRAVLIDRNLLGSRRYGPGLLVSAGSGTSSTGALHSEEVRLPEWVSEVSPVFFFFFPPEVPAAGASALVAAAAATACWYSWSAQISASFLSEGMVMIVIGPGIFRVL